MIKHYKKVFLIFVLIFLPAIVFANSHEFQESIFEAEVVEIVDQIKIKDEAGVDIIQQNLRLKVLEGQLEGREVDFFGISDFSVISFPVFSAGDKVLVSWGQDTEGQDVFYIIDQVRRAPLYLLALIFCLVTIFVGGFKGFRSLVGLAISFLVILNFIIPETLKGTNPLVVSISGAFVILLLIIYLSHGFNKKSSFSIITIAASLLIIGGLSVLFTELTKLTGIAQEEAMYLVGLTSSVINLKGLLLAGIIIGSLGVLDDVVVSQVSLIEQIKKTNPELPSAQVKRIAMKVGVDHISSMINTLFLAYAGASLPLLILFSVNQPPFLTFGQVINNEVIATEIVRTLVGSIGLMLSVPIATYLASYLMDIKEK